MDTTIRNLDDQAFRKLKSRAALEGKTIGELLSEVIRLFLSRARPEKQGSLREIKPVLYPKGNEKLSEEIDSIVYGI